jgi:hypothetical protein
MTGKPQVVILPSNDSTIEIKAVTDHNETVLPKLGVRTFNHSYEIVVVDLAGDPVHIIVIKQNGDVEVDA